MESTFVSRDISADVIPESRHRLAAAGWAHEVEELRAGYSPAKTALAPVACLNDVLLLNRAVAELWGGPDMSGHQPFLDQYQRLVLELVKEGSPLCEIDDRKFIRLIAVMRAHSLYTSAGPPTVRDLCVLKHVWSDTEHKLDLAEKVQQFIDARSSVRGLASVS
jgi:hypothetical protein